MSPAIWDSLGTSSPAADNVGSGTVPFFNAIHFPGSGSNDNVRVRAAISAAKSNGGGVVFLGPIGRDWVMDSISVPTGVHIQGPGRGVKCLLTPNAPDLPYAARVAMFYNEHATTTGDTNLSISNLTLDGNVSNGNARHEWYVGAEVHGVRDFRFQNMRGQNWRGEIVGVYKSYGVENEDVLIEDIVLNNMGYVGSGGYAARQGLAVISGKRVTVRNILGKQIAAFVVDLEADGAGQGFQDCVVENVIGYDVGGGVGFTSFDNGLNAIVRNVIVHDGPSGILEYGVVMSNVTRVLIDGVVCSDTFNQGAVFLTSCLRGQVLGVISVGANVSHIRLANTQGITVANCNLDNAGNATYMMDETGTSDSNHFAASNFVGNPLGVANNKFGIIGQNSIAEQDPYLAYASVASAGTLTIGAHHRFIVVSGTTNISNILTVGVGQSQAQLGVEITLLFTGNLTVVDGGNLKLNGNFVATPDDTLTLIGNGGVWHEKCRSVN